jgi:hypothetical protein
MRGNPHASTDHGTNWIRCEGLGPGLAVTADTVNPSRFYAFDPLSGAVLSSTNGAATFTAATPVLPAAENPGGRGGATLRATPGIEGDLWLASRSRGLYHSRDGGVTFVKLDAVQEAHSLGLGKAAPGRDRPSLFLAGTAGRLEAIFRSDDDGESWVRISDEHHRFGWINHVTGDPRIHGRVYFGTGGRGIIYGDRATESRAELENLRSSN